MQFLRAARFAQRPHPRLLPQRIALLLTGLLVAGMLPGAAGCGVAAEHAPGGEPSATTLPSAGNGAHHAGVTLADGALRVVAAHGGAWQLGLRWTGLGRASRVARVASPDGEARVAEDRASYLREDGSEEWYVNGPLGVEQGFVLAAAPEGARDQALAVEVSVEGDLSPVLVEGGQGIALRDASGTTVARYTDLSASDAGGVSLRSWLEVAGSVIRLRVEDAGARYPVRIDPLVGIPGLFSTGVDDDGVPLMIGDVDSHYGLTSTDPSFPGPFAVVVTIPPTAGWAGNTATSAWIGIQPDALAADSTDYTFTTTFTLAGVDPTTFTLAGQWACDDDCALFLNGTPMAVASYPFPAWTLVQSFTLPPGSPFQLGLNTLAFQVQNVINWTGLQVNFGCTVDTDCMGQWCNESTHTCTPELANGTRIPTDPAHTSPTLDGACTAMAAMLVCASGVCDPADNACGLAGGHGPCTAADGAIVCRSGTCLAAGTCGCAVDTDCTGGTWCDESTGICTPELANGTRIPTDPAHTSPTLDGTCTPQAAALVCQSGVCDTTSNECGFVLGTTCVAADCQSGFCADGVCCDTACTETCMACDVAGSVGTCTFVPMGGTDPSGAVPCDVPSVCDGAGACAQQGCATSADCTAGTFCAGGVCINLSAQQQPCNGDDTECAAVPGHPYCSHGICCDEKCMDPCQQCVFPTAGTCSVQPGVDLYNACADAGTEVCGQSTCQPVEGGGGACGPATTKTFCVLGTCTEDGLHGTGAAYCAEPDGGGPLACAIDEATPIDCTTAYRCAPGLGMCKTRCNTVDDCVPGYVCDLTGQCEPPSIAFPAAPASCSLAGHAGGDEGPWERVAPLLLAGLAVVARRGSARRRPAQPAGRRRSMQHVHFREDRIMPFRLLLKRIGLLLTALLLAGSAGCSADAEQAPDVPPARAPEERATIMPAALRASFLAARQEDGGEAYRFTRASTGSASARNAEHRADVELANGALRVAEAGAWQLGLRWTGLGRGSRIARVASPGGEARVDGNRASYLREDGSEEWYVNGPLGVEQGFVLAAAPEGARDQALAVEVAVEGGLAPALDEGGTRIALRDARGATVVRYAELAAFDAGGASLRSWLEVAGGVVRLRVDDAGARYPVRIDPLVFTEQAELTAGDGAAGDNFGSVSVSGGIAVIGATNHNVGGLSNAGAAYVFVQNGAIWTQQAELTAMDGAASDQFGSAVSVSGGTAVVGAYNHNVGGVSNTGAAYVFVQSGTLWTQQAELTASDGANGDQFGISVSVSNDIAVIGAHQHQVGGNTTAGAAYVFVQSGSTWPQQAELTAMDGATGDLFGTSVSVTGSTASDGTAVVGAFHHNVGGLSNAGAAYVFVQSGTLWPQQAELTAMDGATGDLFGTSVSVSGSTAVVGARSHGAGAAYVFAQSGTQWPQQAELTASDGAAGDLFGSSVSVSVSTAVIGASNHQVGANAGAGAAYVFTQSGAMWTQQDELTASDGAANDALGNSVSVTGSTVMAGARLHTVGTNAGAGAAYVFQGCDVTGCPMGWCDETMNACTSLLANGVAMPTDPPYASPTLDGTCTAAAAALVCQSGACDPADNECGLADGDGPCTAMTAAVCRSGACSTNLTCEPAGGCNVDADCMGGDWCDEGLYACTAQLANGAAIPDDPAHVELTLDGMCTPAAAALVCQSSVCDPADNECGYAPGDGPCTAANGATVCRSGQCSAGGTCLSPNTCNVDADCMGGEWCNESLHACTMPLPNGTPIPDDPAHTDPTLDGKCTLAAGALVCQSAVCDPANNKCGLGKGAGCLAAECQSSFCADGVCCDSACTGTCMACNSLGTCTFVPYGLTDPNATVPCDAPSACDGAGTCGQVALTACTSNDQCPSGTACDAGACVSDPSQSNGCKIDADCAGAAGKFCSLEHVCCDQACTGKCEQCVYPTLGQCSVHAGVDLHGDCTGDAGSEACGSSTCQLVDGAGTCAAATDTTICMLGTCSENGQEGTKPVTCVASEGGILACPADGGAPFSCTTQYLCEPVVGTCKSGCNTVDDCVPGYVCNLSGTCVPEATAFPAAPAGCSLPVRPAGDEGPWGRAALLLLPALAAATRCRRRAYGRRS